ncbi:unnamed protein product, partial [Rhizoctonia solani]
MGSLHISSYMRPFRMLVLRMWIPEDQPVKLLFGVRAHAYMDSSGTSHGQVLRGTDRPGFPVQEYSKLTLFWRLLGMGHTGKVLGKLINETQIVDLIDSHSSKLALFVLIAE